MKFLPLVFVLFLMSCADIDQKPEPLTLKISSFQHLKGWQRDELHEIMPAMSRSCARILRAPPERAFGPLKQAGTYGDWRPSCQKFLALASAHDVTPPAIQQFFEDNFTVWEAAAGSERDGLFTGYYEASLRGSKEKFGPYNTPLYARPDDLIMVNLGEFRDDLKGRRIAGRAHNGRLKPYENRTDITKGQWPHNDKVLLWVDDPVDAFFVQIQGSGLVELPNGELQRIGYAGQNGHPYYAIGRELIKREHLTTENVSMQSIRAWLEANPLEADEIMNLNNSYVFFQALKGDGPLGGEGLPLTPERSLAIDRSQIPYGLPVWVDIEAPLDGEEGLQRLMMAQDTGGAIRGAVRGDVFWGHGARAEYMAGHMKSQGRYWFLLPKGLTPL